MRAERPSMPGRVNPERQRPLAVKAGRGFEKEAGELADRLGAPLLAADDASDPDALILHRGAAGLSLAADGMELRQDFRELLPRVRPDRLARELLVRAVRLKGLAGPLRVVDATAGLGEDAFIMAASGAEVLLCESDPVICALLEDALSRAGRDPELAPVAARMTVRPGDSLKTLAALDAPPDVVYLDPMFPERRKSAAVKKKFQLLHLLERPCGNGEELLVAAIDAGPRKVVVKRPAKGPLLAGRTPSHRVAGKAVRFDCIALAQAAG